MNQGRHGDLLLVRTEAHLPTGIRPTQRAVLAVGESTGHSHVLTAPEVVMWVEKGQQYVKVASGPGILEHPEHGAKTIPVGTYQVMPQKEIDLSGEWKKVED